MKIKTTKKSVMGTNARVYEVSYCGLDFLLKYKTPIAYTCGVYGWNADIYSVGCVAITTGYRPFGKRIDSDLIDKYKKLADEAFKITKDWGERKEIAMALLYKLTEELQQL